MSRIFNWKSNKKIRRKLRNNMPDAEVLLWSELQNKQLKGLKFRRQQGIGPYVVDFYCPEFKLAIELDGDSHFNDEKIYKHDQKRQKYIESFGIKFLRFTNENVYKNLGFVLSEILCETGKRG